MLMEVLKLKGFNTIDFAYPTRPAIDDMRRTLEEFASLLGTTLPAAEAVSNQLQSCRRLLRELDELTWRENQAGGGENHLWMVSSSDFNGDYQKFEEDLTALVKEVSQRQPYPSDELRLAYIGVPAVYAREFYRYMERHGARAVFNEIQRQFAMPEPGKSLAEQYTSYTYPYSIQERLADIQPQLKKRHIDGIIHYTQAFCHRGIGDIIFRDTLDLPVLTLEGNDDFSLNNHVKTRIEAFLDMLERKRQTAKTSSSID
jgi:benzoyl-CoA reductase/2-hydroxyglutaryl-CoA dehydratase subunit BcrC/BadD/HgdB